MRIYLPSTLPALADVLREGTVGPAPVHGFAVTPALREAYASGDEEELEYIAMLAAARESLRLLRSDPVAPRRRVVLDADVSVAADAIAAADAGDEDAGFSVDSAEGHELAWYATQEFTTLVLGEGS